MTTDDLSLNYLKQASLRVEILPEYLKRGGYNIVIREAQEAIADAQQVLDVADRVIRSR